jgi:hypothetical protein
MNMHAHNTAAVRSNKPLMLRVTETVSDGTRTRVMQMDGESEIFFRIRSPISLPPLQVLDFAVIASIFTAMRRGRPLHVAGAVSRSLLANIEEFQDAWAAWIPQRYRVVPVTADREIEPESALRDKGVFAFSGGVDATYSLLRHARGMMGRRGVEPVTALLIHGFDIGLESQDGFGTALTRARSMTGEFHIPISTVETNWQRDFCYDWEVEHVSGIMACLTQFSGVAGTAILGGDEGYDWVDIPWGSNPVSNPFLSSDSFVLRLEGMGATRTERVAFILENSDLARDLRVCWQHGRTGRNCGRCEKCVRTQINILAAGGTPQSFDRNAGFARIAWFPTKTIRDNYFLYEALRAARQRGVSGWWQLAVRIAIVKNAMMRPWLRLVSAAKSAVRSNERLYERLKAVRASHG